MVLWTAAIIESLKSLNARASFPAATAGGVTPDHPTQHLTSGGRHALTSAAVPGHPHPDHHSDRPVHVN